MKLSLIPRQYSGVIYDDSSDRYCASFQISVYGDHGGMYSITGDKFYEFFKDKDHVDELFSKLGVKTLEGYISKAHARLMKVALRHSAKVELREEGEMNGFPMVWVVVSTLNNG